MHLAPLIQDLAVILVTAALVAFVFQRLRQPVVMGYLLAGALVGRDSFLPSLISDVPNVKVWADLGVVFLMFHLGLEFSFRRFQRLGASLLGTGLFEIGFMFALGLGAAQVVGLSRFESVLLAGMISISSTTIIVKALDELKLRTHLFSERVYGLLIVEDLVAVLLIVAIGSISEGHAINGSRLMYLMVEMIVIVVGWFLAGAFLVPRFVRKIGQSENNELLTLLSIGLCLLLAVLAAHYEYSTALGAFIMGSIISETREADRIQKLIHPLRDVFAAVFFVSVGMLVNVTALAPQLPVIALVTAVVVFGKFFALFFGSLLAGHALRPSTRVALSMGQIGEFSFILAGIGIASGRMRPELQAIIVAVAVVTSFATPYLIRASEPLSLFIEARMPESCRKMLDRYALWLTNMSSEGKFFPRWLKPGLGRLLLNAVMVGLLFGVTRRLALPFIIEKLGDGTVAQALGFMLAIALSAPFLFAMLTAAGFKLKGQHGPELVMRTFVFLIATVIWLGILSSQFVSLVASASVTIALSLFLLAFFYRKLEHSYQWLEGRFLSGLSDSTETPTQKAMRELAPWDAHLVRLLVHPNSAIVGHPLHATGLRSQYGLTVIAIRRGEQLIAMPERSELVLPHDELLVLGTDDKIDDARTAIERAAPGVAPKASPLTDYTMRPVRLAADSPLVGETVLSSEFRERQGGMIVGVERGGQRILNPSPHFRLESGDVLWVVAPRGRTLTAPGIAPTDFAERS